MRLDILVNGEKGQILDEQCSKNTGRADVQGGGVE